MCKIYGYLKNDNIIAKIKGLQIIGTDTSDATATEEDVFADATFYAGSDVKKTGTLDPVLEYIKYEDLVFELNTGRQAPSEEEYYDIIKPRVLGLIQYILGER